MWQSQKEKIRNKVHKGNIVSYVQSTKISSNSVKLKEKCTQLECRCVKSEAMGTYTNSPVITLVFSVLWKINPIVVAGDIKFALDLDTL